MRGPERSSGRLVAYLLCFVVLGIGLSTAGPALVHVRDRTGVGVGASGLVLGGQAIGYILGSLAAARPYDRGHGHRALVAGTVAMAVFVGAASIVPTQLLGFVISFALAGAAAGLLDVGGNTMVLWSRTDDLGSSLNALHLCFGIGALLTPIVVAFSVDRTDTLVLVAVVLAIGAVALWALLRGVPTPSRAATHGAFEHTTEIDDRLPAPRWLLPLVGSFFFLYVGAEATMAGWVTTYGEELDLGGADAANLLASVFFAGFTLGRLAAVVVARRMTAAALLLVSCAGAAIASLALAVADHRVAWVWAGTAIVGFLLGPQYASMMAVGDARLRLSGSSTSIIVATSGVGGLVLPVLTGWILDRRSATALPWVVLTACVCTTTVALAVLRSGQSASRRSSPMRTVGHSSGTIE